MPRHTPHIATTSPIALVASYHVSPTSKEVSQHKVEPQSRAIVPLHEQVVIEGFLTKLATRQFAKPGGGDRKSHTNWKKRCGIVYKILSFLCRLFIFDRYESQLVGSRVGIDSSFRIPNHESCYEIPDSRTHICVYATMFL